jgi:hypothetical protein
MTLTFARLVALLTLVALFTMAARPSTDSDTWWHLRAGQWIVEHRAVPTADPFSHTRAGAEWKYPGWLVEVPMHWLFSRLGFAGLNLFTAFFVTLAFLFVYLTCEGHPLVRAFTLVLAGAASAIYWSARPQIVSFALASAFVYLLHLYRWRGVNRLWALVPLMALWANAHGGFAIGFILIGLTLAGQVLSLAGRGWSGRRGAAAPEIAPGDVSGRGVLGLVGVGLACAAAVTINPSGPAMLLYPFKTVSIGVLRDFIQEWQSPDFHELRAQVFLWLLFGTLAAVGLGRQRVNFTDLLLVVGVAYLGLLAWRNAPLLSLVAPSVLTRHLAGAWEAVRAQVSTRGQSSAPMPVRRALALHWTLLTLVTLAALAKIALDAQPAANLAHVARSLPVGAADYVRRARPPGRLFNSYNFGGYLAWALYPDYPVFVDGRTDLYDDEFLREYLSVAFARPGYQATLDRYGVRLVIVEANSILGDTLARDARWAQVYQDETAVVFQKASGP